MEKITQEQINEKLRLHKLWLNNEPSGEKLALSGADLSRANLREANLRGADLREVNLSGANLSRANLREADLSGANLSRANLRWADLSGANLSEADLRGTDLRGADLREVNLSGANLSGANFNSADLWKADLSQCKGLGQFKRVPLVSSFTGYKKAKNCIITLQIPEAAQRVNAIGSFKCRCDKAMVVSIVDINSGEQVDRVSSDHTSAFLYKVGNIVEEPNYDPSDRVECSQGIHFFMTREEALEYNT